MVSDPKNKIRTGSNSSGSGATPIYESPRVVRLGELTRGSGMCSLGSSAIQCALGAEYFQLCTNGSGGLVAE